MKADGTVKKEIKTVLKTLIIFIIYATYSADISKILPFDNEIITMLFSDMFFLILIILLYNQNLKNSINKFQTNYSWKQKIWIVLKFVMLIFIFNIIMGALTELIFPNAAKGKDENALSISNLFQMSSFYTLFKTLIFTTIAEELLFKESIHECIDNKIMFILISSSIYAAFNIIYSDLSMNYIWMDFIQYFLFSCILSYVYIKQDNNILFVILIKFLYNLIPTILLMLGVFS